MKDLTVTSITYFETRRGVGYQCSTNHKDIEIWNDGNGGGTYIKGNHDVELKEDQLEQLINDFEGVTA